MPPFKKTSTAGYPINRKRRTNIAKQVTELDHKNVALLKRYTSEFGQIENRKRNGNTPVSQRVVTRAIKRARILALIPFVRQ